MLQIAESTRLTDSVEKVSKMKLWNQSLKQSNPSNGVLNRCCSFDARLESMLLEDPSQNPFSTVSVR
jgi:hypothetical protein